MSDDTIVIKAPAGTGNPDMTPAEFRAWQAHMGLTVRAAAELLDVAPSTVQAYRTGISRSTGQPVAVPRVVALACAALAAGLGPLPR